VKQRGNSLSLKDKSRISKWFTTRCRERAEWGDKSDEKRKQVRRFVRSGEVWGGPGTASKRVNHRIKELLSQRGWTQRRIDTGKKRSQERCHSTVQKRESESNKKERSGLETLPGYHLCPLTRPERQEVPSFKCIGPVTKQQDLPGETPKREVQQFKNFKYGEETAKNDRGEDQIKCARRPAARRDGSSTAVAGSNSTRGDPEKAALVRKVKSYQGLIELSLQKVARREGFHRAKTNKKRTEITVMR